VLGIQKVSIMSKKNHKKNKHSKIHFKRLAIKDIEDKETLTPQEREKKDQELEKDLKSLKKNVADELKDKNESGDSNDFAKIFEKKHRQRRNRLIVFFSALAVLIAAGAAVFYFYFSQLQPFAEETITLQIDGSQKAVIGQEVNFKISYANTGDIAIHDARLIFHEPHGFRIIKTEPLTASHSWDLGRLEPGQHGETIITGALIDNLEMEQKLSAFLVFTPDNFSSEFSVEQNYYTALEPIKFITTFEAPQTITAGEKVTVNIKLKNDKDSFFEKMKLLLVTPTDFQITNTDPKTALNNNEWLIEKIEPMGELNFKLEGNFTENLTFENDEARLKEFKLQTYYPNADGQYFAQDEIPFQIKIVDQELISYLIINGSTEDKNIGLGDKLQFSIIYKNKGVKSYKDPGVSVIINPRQLDILDWAKIEDAEFGKIEKTLTGKKITWTKTQIPTLDVIEPGEEGAINFSIPIKTFTVVNDPKVSDLGKDAIEAYAQIGLTNTDGAALPPVSSSKINLSLNTNATLGNRAAYYFDDGTPIGAGPLPPKVGQLTDYVVFWEIGNQLHEITDIKVTAVLPDKITWPNKVTVSAGELNFNPLNKELVWTINRLPIGAQNPTVTFHLDLTPQASDAGTLVKLLNNAVLTATDVVTGDTVTQTTNILTTNLDADEFGIGKGVVEQ
jgi:hypothetical protein